MPHEVRWRGVRGHVDAMNERADMLAREAINEMPTAARRESPPA